MRNNPCDDGCLHGPHHGHKSKEPQNSLGDLTGLQLSSASNPAHLPHEKRAADSSPRVAKSRWHAHFRWDRLGIGVSGLCIIHCLLLPLLLVMNPFLTSLSDWHREFHLLIFFLASYFAVLSFSQGYSHHRKRIIPALGFMGCMCILANVFFEFFPMHFHDTPLALILSTMGGCFLILAHYLNIRACRKN